MIKKIDYKLNFTTDIDKQPTIHVNCNAIADIYFKDGRVFKDVSIDWDDCPYLDDPKQFSKEEIIEINKLLNDYDKGLWLGAYKMTNIIASKTIIKTIKAEE